MSVEVVSGTPLAEALQNAVQPKLAEVGWSTGAADDSALSEYIILMLVNGKTQDQIASELSNDLLGLGPEDASANDFAGWLFEQVNLLNTQLNGPPQAAQPVQQSQDETMGDGGDASQDANMYAQRDSSSAQQSLTNDRPTGPKSMRNANPKTRDRRMLGQMNKALDRSGDAALHRIRGGGGVGRINTHGNRDPPKGPRNMANRLQQGLGQMQMGQMSPQTAQNAMMGANPQQQMQMLKLLEEQSRMMAQILGPGANAPAINPAFFNNQQQQNSRSLFDRVEKPRKNSNFRNNPRQNQGDDAMDTDGQENADADKDPSAVACRYQLACTNSSCHFGHQSPAAPPGITLDLSDKCSYGVACMNKKCAASHPSPAQRTQHHTQTDCKFYPNCTNPKCPFKHPSTPPCRNGADCPQRDSGCTFSHSDVMCRYTPCFKPSKSSFFIPRLCAKLILVSECPYRHTEGQKSSPNWTREGGTKPHVSERTFVADEGTEELILPGQSEQAAQEQPQPQDTDVVT